MIYSATCCRTFSNWKIMSYSVRSILTSLLSWWHQTRMSVGNIFNYFQLQFDVRLPLITETGYNCCLYRSTMIVSLGFSNYISITPFRFHHIESITLGATDLLYGPRLCLCPTSFKWFLAIGVVIMNQFFVACNNSIQKSYFYD